MNPSPDMTVMRAEISEQPAALRATLDALLPRSGEAGPRLPECLAPLGLIVPGQLLTEALARRRGIDPDSPRGLSKVTQTA